MQVRKTKIRKKTVKMLDLEATENIKLRWKVARQIQQELLEKKLAQCLMNPNQEDACIKQYPVAMQPMMKAFVQRFQEQSRSFRL